jgi:hypothetical protein
MESAWKELCDAIDHGFEDVDSLITAHAKYLNNIINKGLLSPSVI